MQTSQWKSNRIQQLDRRSNWPAVIVLTVAPLFFSACGEKPQQPPVPQTAPSLPEPTQSEPAKLFQQQRSALDKAKAVEQALEKGSEESRQEMERQAQ